MNTKRRWKKWSKLLESLGPDSQIAWCEGDRTRLYVRRVSEGRPGRWWRVKDGELCPKKARSTSFDTGIQSGSWAVRVRDVVGTDEILVSGRAAAMLATRCIELFEESHHARASANGVPGIPG